MTGLSLLPRPPHLLGGIRREAESVSPLNSGEWFLAGSIGDGLLYTFAPGELAAGAFLTADLLLDGPNLATVLLQLQEGEGGPSFSLSFGLLNYCQARLRLPLECVNQNRWLLEREGALLKPICGGAVVDLTKVDRIRLTVSRNGGQPVRFCLTPFAVTAEAPERLTKPLLPRGPLTDELGQCAFREWKTKTPGASAASAQLHRQYVAASKQFWPRGFSRWGGWLENSFGGSGFFRTHHDGSRWWLVDPDGHPFWSAGMDCVNFGISSSVSGIEDALAWRPPEKEYPGTVTRTEKDCRIDFLRANFIRAFGEREAHRAWSRITLGHLREWGINTVANWSEWKVARAAGMPFVRPLKLELKETRCVFRDFPDVFHASFQCDAAAFAAQLEETRHDSALVGYFLMNEPTWGFAAQTPAEGMWLNAHPSATLDAFGAFLKERHGGKPREEDFREFSGVMAKKLFQVLSDACRRVDPDHLNLGARFYTIPPDWLLEGMDCFDVFSLNCYQEQVWSEWVEKIAGRLNRPVLVGEWHFGALDAGLPASGIGHVQDQNNRGKAYRYYLENAAALPGCIGVHYFTLYDQSVLGRFDGENYNIGFLDICNRPYEALAAAARAAHEAMYPVAAGKAMPFHGKPEYLPLLF